MKEKKENTHDNELICPLLSIGREFLDRCLREQCAFWHDRSNTCSINVIAEKLWWIVNDGVYIKTKQ